MGNKFHIIEDHRNASNQNLRRLIREELLDPKKSAPGRLRIDRTWELLLAYTPDLNEKKVADLGSRCGDIPLQLQDLGAEVKLLDMTFSAQKKLEKKECQDITLTKGCLTRTVFNPGEFDIVLALDVLTEVNPFHHRLFFSELARLVKNEGYIICSTSLDFHSEEPLEELAELAKSEFEILEWSMSFHRALIFLHSIFNYPQKKLLSIEGTEYKQKQLHKKNFLGKKLSAFFSFSALKVMWKVLHLAFFPINQFLIKSEKFTRWLEVFSYFFWADAAISHTIFIARVKKLTNF